MEAFFAEETDADEAVGLVIGCLEGIAGSETQSLLFGRDGGEGLLSPCWSKRGKENGESGGADNRRGCLRL